MATVEKIRKDIEKTKEKISAQQKRLRELEAQLTEEENLEIVRMVKAVRMDNKELTAFLTVSYTHLDVYKRQQFAFVKSVYRKFVKPIFSGVLIFLKHIVVIPLVRLFIKLFPRFAEKLHRERQQSE